MARVYSRSKGQSGSKPVDPNNAASWVKYSEDEIVKLIVKEAKDGLTPSQIGLKLRDTYGIPNVELICKKTITDIINENKLNKEYPEDLMALFKKAVHCATHIKENGQDKTAKRGLVITRSKINRLLKYYKGKGLIAKDFRFDIEQAKLLID